MLSSAIARSTRLAKSHTARSFLRQSTSRNLFTQEFLGVTHFVEKKEFMLKEMGESGENVKNFRDKIATQILNTSQNHDSSTLTTENSERKKKFL